MRKSKLAPLLFFAPTNRLAHLAALLSSMKKRTLYYSAILLTLCIVACSEKTQNNTSNDSANNDEEISEYIAHFRNIRFVYPDSAIHLAEWLLSERRNELSLNQAAGLHVDMGRIYFSNMNNLHLADSVYLIALELYTADRDTLNAASVVHNLAVMHQWRGNFDTALRYFRQSYAMEREFSGEVNTGSLAATYVSFGTFFAQKNDFASARHYFERAILYSRKSDNRRAEALTLLNLAATFGHLYDHKQAKSSSRTALVIFEKLGNHDSYILHIYSNLAGFYANAGRFEEALQYHDKAERLALRLGDERVLGRTYLSRGAIYSNKREHTRALGMLQRSQEILQNVEGAAVLFPELYNRKSATHLALRNYAQALSYSTNALESIQKLNLGGLLRTHIYNTQVVLRAALGDIDESFAMQARRDAYRDSLFTQQRFLLVQELQTLYETGLKQQEIIQQRQEIQAHRTTIFYLIIICSLIAILYIALYIFHRKKLQQQMQIIRQHEELSNYIRKGQQPPSGKTDDIAIPNDLSKRLLIALDQLFESEKIYRDVDVNIVDVANKLGSNRTYLSRVINLYHQKNFSDYVNYYRIEEAKEMLKAQNGGKYSNYTNEYIAEKVGFGSPAQFYRAFKQIVGITSSEYKQVVKEMQQQPVSTKQT